MEIAEALRVAGHDAETVYDEDLAGAPDPRLAEIIRAEARALVTLCGADRRPDTIALLA